MSMGGHTSNEPKKPGIFDEGDDNSGNENHETNLANLAELRNAITPDQVRGLIQKHGYSVPMPEYDAGVMAWRDASLKQLEDYLRKQGVIE